MVKSNIHARRYIPLICYAQLVCLEPKSDYNKLLSLISSPSQLADIRKKLQALKPRLEAAQKGEMDEMLSKLKGLGNSLLGQSVTLSHRDEA
jgi:hypothetical protein